MYEPSINVDASAAELEPAGRSARLVARDAEAYRLDEDARREKNWKRWGPYLSERQWGTVREDYSESGNCWEYFSARSGAQPRLSLGRRRAARHHRPRMPAVLRPRALERARPDPEGAAVRSHRPRGQSRRGREGALLLPRLDADALVHEGALQVSAARVPYAWLVEENRRRGKEAREFEIADTGVFDDGRYFDVVAEYAKASPDDVLMRITVANRGPEAAEIHVLPTLWFRNTWSWGRNGEGYWAKPVIARDGESRLMARARDARPLSARERWLAASASSRRTKPTLAGSTARSAGLIRKTRSTST